MIKDYTNKSEVESASVERLGGIRATLDDWTYESYVKGNEDGENISKVLDLAEEACIAIVNDCIAVDPDNSHELKHYLEDMQTTIHNTIDDTLHYIDTLRLMSSDEGMHLTIRINNHELENVWPYDDRIPEIVAALIPEEVVTNAIACQVGEIIADLDKIISILDNN